MQRTTFRLAALFTSVAALSTLGCGVPDVDPASAVGVQRAALSGVDVAWRRVGKPLYATSIAACAEGDGRLYALNSDRTIWVNRSGGTDSGWSLIIKDNFAHQVLCANNMLYVVNDDRTLWRNDGTDAKVSWTYIGRPGGAKLVTGTTA